MLGDECGLKKYCYYHGIVTANCLDFACVDILLNIIVFHELHSKSSCCTSPAGKINVPRDFVLTQEAKSNRPSEHVL